MDINTKKLKKNAFRVSKVRGLTASRVRVPGGCCNADVMLSGYDNFEYVMQMSCSRWWILPENMETDRFILPHARDLKLKESIWKIWIKLMRCSSRS